jgi:hypothetical protein
LLKFTVLKNAKKKFISALVFVFLMQEIAAVGAITCCCVDSIVAAYLIQEIAAVGASTVAV